jgi:hypothetical protein
MPLAREAFAQLSRTKHVDLGLCLPSLAGKDWQAGEDPVQTVPLTTHFPEGSPQAGSCRIPATPLSEAQVLSINTHHPLCNSQP